MEADAAGGGGAVRADESSSRPALVYAACAASLVLGLIFVFVRAPHPWGWEGFDHYHEIALELAATGRFPTLESAVGVRLLPRGVLPRVRRSSLDPADRSGGPQRADADPGVRARAEAARSPDRYARRGADRAAVVQHRVRVHAVVRCGLHVPLHGRGGGLRRRLAPRRLAAVRAGRRTRRRRSSIPAEPDSHPDHPRGVRLVRAAHAAPSRRRRCCWSPPPARC